MSDYMKLLHAALLGFKGVNILPTEDGVPWSGVATFGDGSLALVVNLSTNDFEARIGAVAKELAVLGFTGKVQPVAPGFDWHIQTSTHVRAQDKGLAGISTRDTALEAAARILKAAQTVAALPDRAPASGAAAAPAPAAAHVPAAGKVTHETAPNWLSGVILDGGDYAGSLVIRVPQGHPATGRLKAAGFKWAKTLKWWCVKGGAPTPAQLDLAQEILGYRPSAGKPKPWEAAPADWQSMVGAASAPAAPAAPKAAAAQEVPAPVDRGDALPTVPVSVPDADSGSGTGPAITAGDLLKAPLPPIEDGPADKAARVRKGEGANSKPFTPPFGVLSGTELKGLSDAQLEAIVSNLERKAERHLTSECIAPEPQAAEDARPAVFGMGGLKVTFELSGTISERQKRALRDFLDALG